MKKILCFLFLCLLVAFSVKFENKNQTLFEVLSGGKVEFFVPANVNKVIPTFASVCSSGDCLFVRADLSLADYLQTQLKDIIGVTIIGNGNEQDILSALHCKVCKTQTIEEKQHIFAFSPFFNDFIFTDGKKTNIHLVVNTNQIFVGVPILYGSY